MRQHRGEEGVSEMVGAMLLIGLTVLGVALVGITFLSGSQPEEIPHTTIVAGNSTEGHLTLANYGGDPLRVGEYRIYVDYGDGLADRTDEFNELDDSDGFWSMGEVLVSNRQGTPQRVVVTAISGGGETILAEPEFRGGAGKFSPDPEPGVTPGPETGGNDSPIQITTPGASEELVFKKPEQGTERATMAAQTTLEDVTRVDFIVYRLDGPYNNEKETIKRDVQLNNSGYYVWNDIPAWSGLSNGDKVAMIAIAYNGTEMIGCNGRVTTVSRL
jgi:hypothetical protein